MGDDDLGRRCRERGPARCGRHYFVVFREVATAKEFVVQKAIETPVAGVVGAVWKAPYRVDVGSAAKRGDKVLEVRVATAWVNRLVGDAQPDAIWRRERKQ